MNGQIIRRTALIFTDLVAILLIFAVVHAEDKKSGTDHSGFQTCQPCHADKYKMWEASGHSKAIARIANAGQASADCYGCHNTEGFAARQKGTKVDTSGKESFHSISCLACHDPRSNQTKRLVADREKLCSSCHSQRAVLEGKGAKGVEDTRSFHSGVSCVSCHMSEGNHLMKVIRPDDPTVSDTRMDTCTGCHKDNNRNARVKQLQDWQAVYKETLDPIQADLTAIEASLKQKPNLLNADLKAKLDALKANLFILQKDGSRGAHNQDFALEIMAQAAASLKEIKAAVNKGRK